MRITKTFLCAAGLLLSVGGAAYAGSDSPEAWIGEANPATAGCYAYQLHFLVMPANEGSERDVGGYVFATNMADDMSRFSGKISGDGHLSGTLTAMHGKAPAGHLEGHMVNGRMMVSVTGVPCPIEAPMVNVPFVDSHG